MMVGRHWLQYLISEWPKATNEDCSFMKSSENETKEIVRSVSNGWEVLI